MEGRSAAFVSTHDNNGKPILLQNPPINGFIGAPNPRMLVWPTAILSVNTLAFASSSTVLEQQPGFVVWPIPVSVDLSPRATSSLWKVWRDMKFKASGEPLNWVMHSLEHASHDGFVIGGQSKADGAVWIDIIRPK